ncbi:hypothetical protein [Erwinia persicina]|uniref:hypothetical protein n=1 Tax=Erwinia persicina TaxID=55211 RepID=UPI000A9BDA97|nr:hypothetical protein [Erwinia persicina]
MEMKKTILACVITTVLLAGCGPKSLSPEEKKEVDNLSLELKKTDEEISYSKEQESTYSGGLIRSLVIAKIQVLETNRALIQQRINAIESGAKIDISIKGTKPNHEFADSISKEITSLKKEISDSKSEASQYSGGLILALKISAIATKEQTLAMLEQKYLSAKYGLAEVNNISLQTPNSSQTSTAAKKEEPSLPPGDGPFGLEEGLSKINIEQMIGQPLVLVEGTKNLYLAQSMPKESDSFEKYALLISPKVGLCQIRALGRDIATDSFGIALQGKFNDLKELLNSIYGPGKTSDFLLTGSIWKEPQDWMMSLNKKERALTSEWSQRSDAMIKSKLIEIGMEARAPSSQNGYIFLQYTFNNNSACESELENEKKSAL